MFAYIGQTRKRDWLPLMDSYGLGEIVQPYEYPSRRKPWALDNGAYADWKNGRPFRAERFFNCVAQAADPDFVVCPDIIAGGAASLAVSASWAKALAPFGHRLALVVQNGMTEDQVFSAMPSFDLIFVGGTTEWKERTARRWVDLAHSLGKSCHIGRAGTARKVAWARSTGCDSIDSCFPLWTKENLSKFISALNEEQANG